jgi:hypothetical protein
MCPSRKTLPPVRARQSYHLVSRPRQACPPIPCSHLRGLDTSCAIILARTGRRRGSGVAADGEQANTAIGIFSRLAEKDARGPLRRLQRACLFQSRYTRSYNIPYATFSSSMSLRFSASSAFAARFYGQRRAKRKTEAIVKQLAA